MRDYELKQSLIEEKNSISSVYPWLFALQLHTHEDLDGYDKIIANTEDFDWVDKDGNDVKFLIFPFNIQGISFTSSGKFPTVTVNIFNTATITKRVEDNNCFLGIPVTLYIINAKAAQDYNTNTYPIQFNFVVVDAKISKYVTLTLGTPNYLTRNVPARQYYRDFCPYEFRQEFCWMKDYTPDPNKPEDFTCDKSWNKCLYFFNIYMDPEDKKRGLPYGGFPDIAKGSAHYY